MPQVCSSTDKLGTKCQHVTSVVEKVSRTENRVQSDKVVELSAVPKTKYSLTE